MGPFAEPIMQRALAEVLVLALACGPLALLGVLYRRAGGGPEDASPPRVPMWALPGLMAAYAAYASLLALASALHHSHAAEPQPERPRPAAAPADVARRHDREELPLA